MISSWLYDKLVPEPPADCPFRDGCQEKWFDNLDSEDTGGEPLPWSDLD